MNAPSRAPVRLADPAELIAALPHLLGFHPRDSLVVVALAGRRLGLTLRADLPSPEHEPALAAQLAEPVARQCPSSAVLVVVGGAGPGGPPPRRELVETVTETLTAAGVPVQHAVWTSDTAEGSPWACYGDDGCAGLLPDPDGTPLAAATVAAGAVTYPGREELAALLDPVDDWALERRATLLDDTDRDHPLSRALARHRLRQLGELHGAAERGALVLDDRTVADVGSALCDHLVRDECLGWSLGDGAVAAEQLWMQLTRATPAPERAEPAALLAATAYLRGDGALAGIAVDVALAACPPHALAGLLRAALEGGLPPDALRTVVQDAVADVRLLLDEPR